MAKRSPSAASTSVGSHTRSRDSLIQELTAITATIIGSAVSADAPLMSAGLDSIATTELSALMSERFNTELPQTLLFDHPSLQSVADFLLLEQESVPIPESEPEPEPEERKLDSEAAGQEQLVTRSTRDNSTATKIISAAVLDVLGTTVATDAPLMSVGLDSIAVTELTNALAEKFDTELPQTLMFDHPTIDAMATFIAETTEAPVAAAAVERETVPTRTMAAALTMSGRDAPDRVFLASRRIRFTLPGGCNEPTALK